jgi:uncharacterized membrane protein
MPLYRSRPGLQRTPMNEKSIHRLFQISIWLKGLHSLVEIIGGILIALISTGQVTSIVKTMTAEQLLRNPHDLIANYLLRSAAELSIATKTFAAFYLLSHGVVKLFLVVSLLRDKLWAYPASLVVLALFITYQIYRFTLTHSPALMVLTLFDLLVIWLILHEYRLIRLHLPRG